MRSSAPTWIDEFVNTILQKPPLTEAPDQLLWSILEDRDSGAHFVQMNGESYRIVGFEPIGWGFSLALLGAQYEHQCRAREWPASLLQVLQREYGKARYHALALTHRHSSAMPIPVMTALEENGGNWHLLELAGKDDEAYWALATLAAHLLAERLEDASRFDDYGDFLTLGAPSIVQRHSTERIPKHISQKVIYDHRLCTHCLRCTTVCNEMRAIVTEKGARLLGPSEDFCTNCGLCQQRCSFLTATPKDELVELAGRRTGVNEGGPAFYFHGEAAENYLKRLKSCANGEQARFPYSVQRRLAGKPLSSDIAFTLPIAEQFQLDASSHPAFSDRKPLLVTSIGADNAQPQSLLIRTLQRVTLVLQTASGTVEQQMARAAMKLGLDLTAVDCGNGGITFPANDAGKLFYQLGRPAITDQSLTDLWRDKKIDLILAPFADRIPAELHQLVMEQTGRQAQILSPHIRQALPFSRNPLLNELGSELTEIFISNPELMDAESSFARELLRDIPRNHALLHARYRNLAFASGHTACPSCAEAQVLAIPVYMAMAMSLARKEIPQVYFTCETGCMSETLNKVNEVSQKVPGGRTVFGGGFAFGEAVTMAQDHAVRMGYLSKGRRYVVSQGGDGGAVIGLPAWLNALRQQAFMISQRYANVLHFITITDTQVYSNTGGESSATSLVGMGTLTTPVGKFLLGNQKIQWTLINLAAELPGVLVASGHSANRVAMQEFWHLADRLGQSAIRWDVTPCPETGKFFGEDPDDLAEVMAHAGMLPEILFIGRFRKRIAPYHPEDRNKPYGEWSRQPKPVTYWLHRDPRYRALFQRNPESGKMEPRNLAAQFLITQLENFRDQLNWQIDLETYLVRQAEDWSAALMQELKETWKHYRYRLEQFPYAMLFNRHGDLKPEYAASLEREIVQRILGWDQLARYAAGRDGMMQSQQNQLEEFIGRLEELEKISPMESAAPAEFVQPDAAMEKLLSEIRELQQNLHEQILKLKKISLAANPVDPIEEELFRGRSNGSQSFPEARREALHDLLDRILEERGLARHVELQQYRLAQQLKYDFLKGGGLIQDSKTAAATGERDLLFQQINRLGPFSIGVASLAGDRGIAINRIFASFFTAKGVWAGMAWQFGSSKRGTPVLSATFVDSKPLQRKDAMYSFPVAVLTVTNFEDMKRQPDLFFGQLHPRGFIIINSNKAPGALWHELVSFYPEEVRQIATELRERFAAGSEQEAGTILEEVAQKLWNKSTAMLTGEQLRLARKISAMAGARIITVDMNGIILEVTGSAKVVSNLVAVGPIFQALQQLGFPFVWERDLPMLTEGFPGAVIKNKKLLHQYYAAMERAKALTGLAVTEAESTGARPDAETGSQPTRLDARMSQDDPSRYLMIMGGTLAGMVLSQIATAEHPVFYIGFPITPAGNPFYAMAEAFANGHPYIVVDEVNPSEKVAAEKLLGVARCGGFLPVTFTASQGWRLFTEIIPQFVGARLEGLFLIAKRALAAPNLNIEESHTDFMSFRDDGGIMLAPKGIQEYVPALYLARLLTHFAKMPVILSIGGITDTHKIGLVKVPSDDSVRAWLKKTLWDFDYLEHKLVNRQGDLIVHGPSGTSAVYQETQSEIEKAHQAVTRIYPYAVRAVHDLTGTWLDELEINSATPTERIETLLIMQGSLYPNAAEALEELEEKGWSGMACISVRCFNPFPEEKLFAWFNMAQRIVVLDRSNSFGSIPPLASRILSSLARFTSCQPASAGKQLRILVGGLGGREITVAEMKEIFLSTHLLFVPPQEWEAALIREWLEQDPILRAMLQEAAALDLRNTNRHTRVPTHLRYQRDQDEEFEARTQMLKRFLSAKNYTAFLAAYQQVEFVGQREILQESTLLQQVVLYVEIRLARHGIESGQADKRHALLLLRYGREQSDRDLAKRYLEENPKEAEDLSAALMSSYGVAAGSPIYGQRIEDAGGLVPRAAEAIELTSQESRPQSNVTAVDSVPSPQPQYSSEEAQQIEELLTQMVTLQGEEPLFYNPEDFEHELVSRLQKETGSALFELNKRCLPAEAEELLLNFRHLYRDTIDRTLHREILAQHHAPELRELFEGEGMKRLTELVERLNEMLQAEPLEKRQKTIARELERYLEERCLPGLPKNPSFYLEYYRDWVVPGLLQID